MTTIKRNLVCYTDKRNNKRVFFYFPQDILDGIKFDEKKHKRVELWHSKNTVYAKILTKKAKK
jgi:hypothetical protein